MLRTVDGTLAHLPCVDVELGVGESRPLLFNGIIFLYAFLEKVHEGIAAHKSDQPTAQGISPPVGYWLWTICRM
jgi:hypothetical protein